MLTVCIVWILIMYVINRSIITTRRGKCKVQEEGSSRTRQVPQTLIAPQQLIDEDLPLNPTLDSESLQIEGNFYMKILNILNQYLA